MNRIITLTLILAFFFSYCDGQTEGEKDTVKQQTLIALKKWFQNPSLSNNQLDPSIIKSLKDSGRIERSLKEGYWVQYSLDTSLKDQQVEVTVGTKKLPFTFSATLQKETGNYLHGKKNGVWMLYDSYDTAAPFDWEKNTMTNYKKGLKDGEEVMYQGNGIEKPAIISHWKNGAQDGLSKIYYDNPPYNLKQVYKSKDGKPMLFEEYYSSGQLQRKCIDTTINRQKFHYCREYFESGNIKTTGSYSISSKRSGIWKTFYEDGKIESIANFVRGQLDGNFKYFYDNGQLWTLQVYKQGNLIEVISNYNSEGKTNDPGTIKNGTGTVNIYDVDGKLTETHYFVNGKDTKSN